MISKKRRWLAACLCLMIGFCLGACRETSAGAAGAEEPAIETTLSAQSAQESSLEETTKPEKKKKEETKETERKEKESTSKETQKEASSSGETTKVQKAKAANSGTKESKVKKETKAKKPSGHVLTVKKGGKEVYFTEQDLASIGTVSYKYSYRNKESEHRQFETCTGVKLSSILSKSGFSGSRLRFRSKDGYTKEFSAGELKSNKKAFLKTTGSSAKSVPAILTLSGSEAFRLCFGQSADDTDESGDYNAQHWVKWVESIEIL